MTENPTPIRSALTIRLSRTEGFIQRVMEWERQYLQFDERGLQAVQEFGLEWEQIKQVYEWAAKYMPSSVEWRGLYCQLTNALAPFWRRRNENETIQRKWLLCALRTATQNGDRELRRAFLEHMGNLSYDTNAFQKAVLYYKWALDSLGNEPDRAIEARLLVGQANAMRDFAQRQRSSARTLLEEAEILYQKALELALPESSVAERIYGNYGILKVRQDRAREAIDLFLQALTLARALSDLVAQRRNLGNLSSAYQNVGNFEEAMRCATEAIEIADRIREPRGRSQSYAARGFIHRKQGRMEAAVNDFKKSFKIANEAGLQLIAARQADNLSEIYFASGQLEEAVSESEYAYSVALKKNVGREIGFHGFTHGWNLVAVGRFAEAVTVFSNVTAQVGGQATLQALVARGVAHYLLNEIELALADVENAIAQAQKAVAASKQYKALQVIGLGEVVKLLCEKGTLDRVLEAYREACSVNHEQGSVKRQIVLLQYVDRNHDTRLDEVRALLKSYLTDTSSP